MEHSRNMDVSPPPKRPPNSAAAVQPQLARQAVLSDSLPRISTASGHLPAPSQPEGCEGLRRSGGWPWGHHWRTGALKPLDVDRPRTTGYPKKEAVAGTSETPLRAPGLFLVSNHWMIAWINFELDQTSPTLASFVVLSLVLFCFNTESSTIQYYVIFWYSFWNDHDPTSWAPHKQRVVLLSSSRKWVGIDGWSFQATWMVNWWLPVGEFWSTLVGWWLFGYSRTSCCLVGFQDKYHPWESSSGILTN